MAGAAGVTLSRYFANRSVTSAARFRLYQITTRFAQGLSRLCRERGIYVSPEKLNKFVGNFLLEALEKEEIRPEQMEIDFCLGLQQALALSLDEVRNFVQESGVLRKLFDWGALNKLAPVNFVQEAALLEAQGNREQALTYYKAAVAGYENGEAGILQDYFSALKALSHLDQGNPAWEKKLSAKREEIRRLGQNAVPDITLSPEYQKELWQEIKRIIIERLKGSGSYYEKEEGAAFLIVARLAVKEDREAIKGFFQRYFFSDHIFGSPKMMALVDAFIKFMTPEDFAEIIGKLGKSREHHMEKEDALACALVQRTKYREAIPKLLEWRNNFRTGSRKIVDGVLLDILSREDLPLVREWLKSRDGELVDLGNKALGKVFTPEDVPELFSMLEKAEGNTKVAILLALGKVGDRTHIPRIEPYLMLEKEVSVAAAKAICALAGIEDVALVRNIAYKNMHKEAREKAVAALGKLDSSALKPAAVAKEYGNSIEEAHARLWTLQLYQKDGIAEFTDRVTKEDISTDRWNLRKMLFDPAPTVVRAALMVLEKYAPDNILDLLIEAYEHNRTSETEFSNLIWRLITAEDQNRIEKMLSLEKPRHIKWLGIDLVERFKFWQFMPQIRVLAKAGMSRAKEALLSYAGEEGEWSTAYQYVTKHEFNEKAKAALAKAATTERLPQLKEMLKSREMYVPEAALYVLERLLDKQKTEPAIEETPSASGIQLGYNPYTPPTTIPGIIREIEGMLTSFRGNVRKTKAAVLAVNWGKIEVSDAQIEELLSYAVRENISFVRDEVFSLAARTKNKKFIPGMLEIIDRSKRDEQLDAISQFYGVKDLRTLRRKLKVCSNLEKIVILKVLARLGDGKDKERVKNCLEVNDSAVCEQAMFTYGELAPREEARQLIEEMLFRKDISLRKIAIKAATRLGLVELMPLIRARFKDNYTETSPSALEFFVKHGSRAEMPLILEKTNYNIDGIEEAVLHFISEEELPMLRQWCATGKEYYPALVKIGMRAFSKLRSYDDLHLVEHWAEEHFKVEDSALAALISLQTDKQALFDLLNKKSDYKLKYVRSAALQSLLDFWEEGDIEIFKEFISRENAEELRKIAFEVLAKKAPEVALEYLPQQAGHFSWAAWENLVAEKPDEMLGLARQKLEQSCTPIGKLKVDKGEWIWILGELGGEEELPFLFQQLTNHEVSNQVAAAEALGKILLRIPSKN